MSEPPWDLPATVRLFVLRLATARESSVSEVRPSAKPRLKIGHGRGSLKGPLSTRGLRATRPHKGWTSWVLGFGNPWYFTLSQARSSWLGLEMSQYSTSVIENLYPLGTQYTNLFVYLLTCFQIIKIYQNIGGEVCEVCYPFKIDRSIGSWSQLAFAAFSPKEAIQHLLITHLNCRKILAPSPHWNTTLKLLHLHGKVPKLKGTRNRTANVAGFPGRKDLLLLAVAGDTAAPGDQLTVREG